MPKNNNDINIQPVIEEDRDQLALLFQNAFRITREMSKGWTKDLELNNSIGLYERGRLVSALLVHQYKCFLGGLAQSLGGIGGVVTGADSQGRGYAGKILKASFQRMRENDQAVSTLYPFSCRFYREFGWGRACQVRKYEEIRQQDLIRYQESRMVRRINAGDALDDLARLHNEVMSRYNLTFSRSVEKWEKEVKGFLDGGIFLYGIYDGNDLIGYFDCHDKNKSSGDVQMVSQTRRLALSNETAVRAMIGFLARLPVQVKNIVVVTPVDIDLFDYMTEPSGQSIKESQQFRIVSMNKAVERRGYGEGVKGRLVVRIVDEHCPWNEGTWEIVVDGGSAEILQVDSDPMLTADIDVFSTIFCGYKPAAELAFHGDCEVFDEMALTTCDDLFFDNPTFTQDWF